MLVRFMIYNIAKLPLKGMLSLSRLVWFDVVSPSEWLFLGATNRSETLRRYGEGDSM
jgi:hypothetical protein